MRKRLRKKLWWKNLGRGATIASNFCRRNAILDIMIFKEHPKDEPYIYEPSKTFPL